MRAVHFVEAVVALALGAGGGMGFLFQSGDLKTPAQVEEMQSRLDGLQRDTKAKDAEAFRLDEEQRRAEEARVVAAAAAAKAKADAEARAAAAAAASAAAAPKLPAFGLLTIKAASDLDVEHADTKDRGKSVELGFESAPQKIKIKGGKFTVNLTPRVQGSKLVVDVSVSPMAIIQADGERKGVSTAQGISVTKSLKLDLQSPAAGDLNLVLLYKK